MADPVLVTDPDAELPGAGPEAETAGHDQDQRPRRIPVGGQLAL